MFEAHGSMRVYLCFVAPLLLCAATACSTIPHAERQCNATSLHEVIENPLRYAGSWFCGEAVVAQPARVTRIMTSADEVGSYGTVVMATTATRRLLGEVGSEPSPYYIEAKIDPMAECFVPAHISGEQCSPFARPVMFHIRRATRRRR